MKAGGQQGPQRMILREGTYTINLAQFVVITAEKVYTLALNRDDDAVIHQMADLITQRHGFTPVVLKDADDSVGVVMVPTTNIILKWNRREVGSHRFDENLAEVSLITKDAFEPLLPLSVVVHIDYRKAPRVIQRFGDVKRLVEQTLDPLVAAYFKNIGQTRTLIQLIHERSEIQDLSSRDMHEKFARYNLELEEVLIGTPTSLTGRHPY